MKISTFLEFISEDFATLGSVLGMGDTSAPTPTSVGSGDAWPSLTNGVWTAQGQVIKKRRIRRKNKKNFPKVK